MIKRKSFLDVIRDIISFSYLNVSYLLENTLFLFTLFPLNKIPRQWYSIIENRNIYIIFFLMILYNVWELKDSIMDISFTQVGSNLKYKYIFLNDCSGI